MNTSDNALPHRGCFDRMYTIGDKHFRKSGEFIFRPRGAGRFGNAAFLMLWLCFWAVGEALALFFIGEGI
jgi:hypothetical protein